MQSLDKVVKAAAHTITEYSPVILTAFGVAGIAATTVLAVRATPAALQAIEEEDRARYAKCLKDGFDDNDPKQLTRWEIVKLTWRFYIPAGLMGLATASSVVGVNSIHTRRNAALASVYTLTETALREYQEKVIATIGSKDEAKVREALDEDHLAANPVSSSQVIITGNGDMLCYETLTGRYFMSNIEALRQAQNNINAEIINNMYASQNDFYSAIQLYQTEYGDELGWEVGNLVDLEFSSKLADDGRLCLVVSHRNRPRPNYYKN